MEILRNGSDQDIIRLNIGGKEFVTRRATLCGVEGSRLEKWFRIRTPFQLPPEIVPSTLKVGDTLFRQVFVDRDPEAFGLVLSYLRDGLNTTRSFRFCDEQGDQDTALLGKLIADADFFGLSDLKVQSVNILDRITHAHETNPQWATSPVTHSTLANGTVGNKHELHMKQAEKDVTIFQAGSRKAHGLAGKGSSKITNPEEMPWIVIYGGVYFSTSSKNKATRFGLCLVKHFKRPADCQIACLHCDKKFPSQQRLNLHLALQIDSGKCVDCSDLDNPECLQHFELYSGPWTYWVEDKLIKLLFESEPLTGEPEDLINPTTQQIFSRCDHWFVASKMIQERSQSEFQRLKCQAAAEGNKKWLRFIQLGVQSKEELVADIEDKSERSKKMKFTPQPWFYTCGWLKPYPIWPDAVKSVVKEPSGGS